MSKNKTTIPVNTLPQNFGDLIFISRKTFKEIKRVKEFEQAHRDDWHLFLLPEKGTTVIEIDYTQVFTNSIISS
ncbi:MAG: hypothetical protein QM802_23175 [Agriterribacter sp.]